MQKSTIVDLCSSQRWSPASDSRVGFLYQAHQDSWQGHITKMRSSCAKSEWQHASAGLQQTWSRREAVVSTSRWSVVMSPTMCVRVKCACENNVQKSVHMRRYYADCVGVLVQSMCPCRP